MKYHLHLLCISLLILVFAIISPTKDVLTNIHFSSLTNTVLYPLEKKPIESNHNQTLSWAVTGATTNIRMEPSTDAPIILQAKPESWFPILERKNNWDKIQIGSERTGWIADWVIQTKQLLHSAQVVQVAPSTQLSNGPGLHFQTLSLLETNHDYLPLKVEGFWVQIQSMNTAANGWVPISEIAWKTADDATLPKAVAAAANLDTDQGALLGKTIVIDPGHGGTDTGAIGTPVHIYERDVNMAVASVLQSKLVAAGANVIMTRTNNDQTVSLAERTAISNERHADLFISIHQNMYRPNPAVGGTITYYEYESSKKAAEAIEKGAVAALSPSQSQSKLNADAFRYDTYKIQTDDLYVLRNNLQPAVLIEGCFLSNPKEVTASMLPSYQEHLASGIYQGVLNYFGK